MPHHPKPFFKNSRGAWYVEINRKQIKLGTDREKAFQIYHQLMIQPREQSVSPELLASIVDLFLDWVQKNRSPDEGFRNLLRVTYLSGCRPQESLIVQAEHVDAKLCRWVFPQSQAKGKRAPRIVYLTEPAMEIVKYLTVRFPSGSLFRNSNGRSWTTDAVNCVFDRIQTRMGKALIKEPASAVSDKEIAAKVKELKPTKKCKGAERNKTEAELRYEAKHKLLRRKAQQLVPRYSLYALRHSWATNALKSGVDPLTVAILMGHKDPSMLARVYQHLSHSPSTCSKRTNERPSKHRLLTEQLPSNICDCPEPSAHR